MNPLYIDPAKIDDKPPRLVDNPELITQAIWWRAVDESGARFNWSHCHERLKPQPNKASRWVADILHQVIDGYFLEENKEKIIQWKIHEKVSNEINKDIKTWEVIRSNVSQALISSGHGQLRDYFHVMRLYLAANKRIEAPEHITSLVGDKEFTELREYIEPRIDEIIYKICRADVSQPIRNLLQPDAFVSDSGKGARKRDNKFIPDYIRKAAVSIIDKNQSKGQAQMYSGVPESTFDDNWREYKYMALIDYVLESVHMGYVKKDKPVQQIKKGNEYEMHLTLTQEQHSKITSLWELKDLPNPIIVSNYNVSKEYFYIDE